MKEKFENHDLTLLIPEKYDDKRTINWHLTSGKFVIPIRKLKSGNSYSTISYSLPPHETRGYLRGNFIQFGDFKIKNTNAGSSDYKKCRIRFIDISRFIYD